MIADPEIKTFGDVVVAIYGATKIIMEFSRIHEHKDTLSAELRVTNEIEQLHWSRVNMASASGRHAVVKALDDAHPIDGWRAMLDRACQAVAQHLRTGDPAQEITPTPPAEDTWLVSPWVPLGEITVVYGPGGTAKSLFCLATVLAGIMGHTLGSPWAVGSIERCLYLDWESGKIAHDRRAFKLLRAIEDLPPGRLFHKRLRRPLADVIPDVRAEAFKLNVDAVILDSLGAASGAEPETAGAALGTLQAVGSLPGTKIVIAHESKAALDQAQGKPFGSIYVENTARSTIEMRPQESTDSSLTVTLRHAKQNDGPRAQPLGVTFTFGDSIIISRAQADPSSQSLAHKILAALTHKRGVAELAEDLDANKGSVKTELYRLEGRSKVLRFPGKKGEETQWARIDDQRSN